jgi:hypothetical protein
VKAAVEATTVVGPDGSSGSGPGTMRTDARGAPDATPDSKAVGKRPTTTIGSGGSNPPPPASTFAAPKGMPHIFVVFFIFSLFAQAF